MSLLAPVSATTAIVLAVLFVKLAFAVIKKRQLHKVVLGSGQHADLEAAIRAHGNFAEYVPLALLLIVFAEINRSPWWLVAIAALALVAGRYIHAMAMTGSDLKKRVLGMQLTFASLALGVVANVVPMVLALINMPKS
jgi:uncharacterized membrane protein YecN with MAPEG domain